jgi:UDP-N-acetylmuramoyl-L-alanyl-D-glutamate--2,6-diaminopimelate ligase
MDTSFKRLGDLVAALGQRMDAASGPAAPLSQEAALREVRGLAYRSDEVSPGDLFFCVPGSRADGHDFAADAAARGAVALAVERPLPVALPQLRFDDTRLALAHASCAFYDDPSAALSIAAVTGTNGKTTTAYLLDWVCRHAPARRLGASSAALTGLIGTVETRVGAACLPSKSTTPESLDLQRLLAQMREAGIRHVNMEVSSHALALHRVAGVRFAVAAFSNLTQDHLDFHGSMEAYFEAKAALFDSPLVAGRAIDIDTEYGRRLVRRCEAAGRPPLTCGLAKDAEVGARDIAYSAERTSFTMRTPEGAFPLSYPLIGPFNVSNVLLASAAAYLLGFSFGEIRAALAEAPQVPGRLERVRALGLAADDVRQPPLGVFVDYAHTPDSIAKALEALNALKDARARTLIVFGCGGDRDKGKRPLMGAAALAADYAVVTSDNPRSEDPEAIIADILPGMAQGAGRYEVEPDRRRAIARALAAAAPGDLVLIAGKGHEDYQLVKDRVLAFDDRLVAAEELRALADGGRWPSRESPREPSQGSRKDGDAVCG